MNTEFLPPLPDTGEHQSAEPREKAFNWLRHIGLLLITAANVDPESPAAQERHGVYFNVLRGLLNRSARLVVAMLKISSDGRHGEAAAILARCTVEGAVNGCWLIDGQDEGFFERYIADGLKAESKFCDLVRANIEERGGKAWAVERRMLDFEKRAYELAEMSEEDVLATPKLQDFNSRLVRLKYGDLAYAALYRVGSHSVHGTWPDLLDHYLEGGGPHLNIRDNDVPVNDKHYLVCSLHLLEFIRKYLGFAINPCDERKLFHDRLDLVEEKVFSEFKDSNQEDYEVTDYAE